MEIQNSFFCDGLSRFDDGMSCYANEAGRIVARSRQAAAVSGQRQRIHADLPLGHRQQLVPVPPAATSCNSLRRDLNKLLAAAGAVNGRCSDCGLAHGDADLRQSLDDIPAAYRPDGGHLVLVDGKSAISVLIRSQATAESGGRVARGYMRYQPAPFAIAVCTASASSSSTRLTAGASTILIPASVSVARSSFGSSQGSCSVIRLRSAV